MYLNHFLDRPWAENPPGLPMIRVERTLLVLPDQRQAEQGKETLHTAARTDRYELKGVGGDASIPSPRGRADW